MRNYLSLNFVRLNFGFGNPGDPPTESRWITGTSVTDMGGQIQWAYQQLGFPTNFEVEGLGIYYFPLDKTNMSRIWNFCSLGFPLSAPIFSRSLPGDEAKTFKAIENTPRRGFTDAAGKKLAVPPSDGGKESDVSGGQTLVENFLALMDSLIKKFTKAGDKRTVGILQYLLKQFLDGKQSITDILLQLHDLFIV
jgi:hypothetical protein